MSKMRVLAEAAYLICNEATVRKTAEHFGVPKSTVYDDVTKKLRKINVKLYNEAQEVLQKNKAERAVRGGKAKTSKK